MTGKPKQLEELGAALARAQDAALETLPLPRQVLTATLARRWWWPVLAGAGVLGVASAAALYLALGSHTLSLEIDGAAARDPSAWISVAPAAETPLRFSDGSTLLLVGGSRARVVALSSRGAHLQLERGRAVVSVVHRDAARWQVDAGPYTVEVTGTRFEVAWDASAQSFSLAMQEGSVHVRGPGLADRVLVAGQSLVQRLGAGDPRAAAAIEEARAPALPVASAEPAEPTEPAPVPAAPPELPAKKASASPVAAPVPAPAPPIASPPAASPAGFRALCGAGRYAEALAAVRAGGVDETIAGATADDLLLMGDAARLAGDPALSRRALETIRGRFPGSGASARACFLLGRLAFDAEGQPVAAASWFARYLEEAPGGPLAREALGRLVESLAKAGDRPGAEARARQYLEQYPNGPYAALARSLLPR